MVCLGNLSVLACSAVVSGCFIGTNMMISTAFTQTTYAHLSNRD